MSTKIIFSYSLYGSNERYVEPMLQLDLERIKSKFNRKVEFQVFCNVDVPYNIVEKLRLHGCIVYVQDFEKEKIGGMFARYQPIFRDDDSAVIVRDIDSYIGNAEIELIIEWLNSDCDFHIIRDHALHIYPIMGGLFGAKGDAKKIFTAIYQKYRRITQSNKYNKDQIFLCEKIYPALARYSLVHSRRIVYKQENHRKIQSDGSGFAGETRVVDEKRKREYRQSLSSKDILVLPIWLSKVAIRKPFNRIITFISLQFK